MKIGLSNEGKESIFFSISAVIDVIDILGLFNPIVEVFWDAS